MAAKKTTTKKTTTKKPRPSSTGKRNPKVDQTNWREKYRQSRIKFDDEQKEIYLKQLADHGLKGTSARAAGVALETVRSHIDNDPEFAALVDDALDQYRDQIVEHHRKLVLEGEVTKRYNKDGDLISEETKYPIPLIAMELKRVDHDFREKQQVDLTHSGGGVLIAPAEKTPEQWVAEAERANAAKKKPTLDN